MPKIEVIARLAILRGQWLLACRNIAAGYYYLPGGHLEFGESAGAAAVREFLEETGQAIRISNCHLVTEETFESRGRHHHEVNLVFHGELFEPEQWEGDGPPPTIPSLEPGIAFDWIDVASLIGADFRPATIRAWLASGGSGGSCTWVSAFPHPQSLAE